MNIRGTAKNDFLRGGAEDDVIDGRNGADRIDGGAGDDYLIGGQGGDRFIFRAGGGNDVIADFNPGQGDKILFDFGTWSDYMVFGRLQDGQSWSNFTNTATWSVAATDVNNDGKTDTTFYVTHAGGTDSITVLGWAPQDFWGQWLTGG